jgi:hypothetical protein
VKAIQIYEALKGLTRTNEAIDVKGFMVLFLFLDVSERKTCKITQAIS